MATETANGSQAATVGVEHSLNTQTTAGVYMGFVSLVNMVAGDEVEVYLKTKARSADGSRALEQFGTYTGVQTQPIVSTRAIFSSSWELLLKQTAGTSRTFTWSVYIP